MIPKPQSLRDPKQKVISSELIQALAYAVPFFAQNDLANIPTKDHKPAVCIDTENKDIFRQIARIKEA